MSEIVDAAVTALNRRLAGAGIDGAVRFVIEDEGALLIGSDGAVPDASDDDADCTLTASAETFQDILAGDLDATSAFMSGRLKVEGNMGLAMKLGTLLS
jgi:putative sterol carrier protein